MVALYETHMSALTLVSNKIQYFSSHFHFFYVQRTKRRTLFHLHCLSFQRYKIDDWSHLSCIVPDIWRQWGCLIYALNVGALSSANTISQRVYSSYCSVETNIFGIGEHWFFRSDELCGSTAKTYFCVIWCQFAPLDSVRLSQPRESSVVEQMSDVCVLVKLLQFTSLRDTSLPEFLSETLFSPVVILSSCVQSLKLNRDLLFREKIKIWTIVPCSLCIIGMSCLAFLSHFFTSLHNQVF